ncbi:actin-related protein 6-like [Anopheles albimanus]|uniref:Actin-related protein 6 n=1 Tax=Anopheles albimanus TaxID=7167 RepID=A0A182FH22_ANOAL|nr:actin-related protein 6-like [Anopheles albimanus]
MGDGNVFILDNGAFYAKLGMSDEEEPKTILNCITKAKSERRRPFVGNQIDECRDVSGLFYILCFQRGYLVNWDVQKTVWDYFFSSECYPVQFSETPLLITEPLFNFGSIQEAMLEILYEEYDCDAVCKTTAVDMAAFNYTHGPETMERKKPLCCVVVETGFSFTHIVPFIKGTKVREAIRRIDVGGKVLTNHLKEIISYRQLNVMDESHVINQVKEDSCFVSQNFVEDMRIARKRFPDNTIVRDYMLPDYTQIRRGFLRKPNEQPLSEAADGGEELQAIRLGNERFVIPEILFHPSDVGIQQMGIPEAIVDAINACAEETRPHLFANIIVCGGCALFPGMQTRVEKDVRALAPDEYEVNVMVPKNPITYAWQGGKQYSQSLSFLKSCMSRNQYEEYGTKHLVEKYES